MAEVTRLRTDEERETLTLGAGVAGTSQMMRVFYPSDLPDASRLAAQRLVVVGLAAPFNVSIDASARWGGRWQFRPGAFARAIREQPVALQVMHNDAIVVASTADRSLSLWEGVAGLMFRLNPPDTVASREVLRHALNGAFIGASIGLRPSTSISADVGDLSSFIEVDLCEVSLVSKRSAPRFGGTWVKVMPQIAGRRLEDEAESTVAITQTRSLVYAGRPYCFHGGETYRLPVCLAQRLVTLGVTTGRRVQP